MPLNKSVLRRVKTLKDRINAQKGGRTGITLVFDSDEAESLFLEFMEAGEGNDRYMKVLADALALESSASGIPDDDGRRVISLKVMEELYRRIAF